MHARFSSSFAIFNSEKTFLHYEEVLLSSQTTCPNVIKAYYDAVEAYTVINQPLIFWHKLCEDFHRAFSQGENLDILSFETMQGTSLITSKKISPLETKPMW